MQYAWYFKLEPKQGKKKLLTLALPSEQNTLQYLYIYIYIVFQLKCKTVLLYSNTNEVKAFCLVSAFVCIS